MSDGDQSDSKSDWRQIRSYVDHLGHPLQGCSTQPARRAGLLSGARHLVPIQVYSLVALGGDDDHQQVREYLLQGFYNDEVSPLLEAYSYFPRQ